ncbi:hypothetical protein [Clostridium intestinale]|uniref:hypothetical protein n=1 Tax=Clostridium intestinale TaxID=36845 RepID=UPI002DD61C81|nr:hypothetical protein [Clostridium intestinale]WRY53935.1 hypothetical protein P8F83_12145 [Clostridium intestinale]
MSQLDSLKYDNLIAGDYCLVTEPITIDSSQDILRGDVLIKASGKYKKASAAVIATDVIVIASENIKTDASTTVESIGYRTGYFNSNAMRFGGASTVDNNKDILADKSIYLTSAQRQ